MDSARFDDGRARYRNATTDTRTSPAYITPTIHSTDLPSDRHTQNYFHNNNTLSAYNSSARNRKSYLPLNLDPPKDSHYTIPVSTFSTSKPLQLASKCILDFIKADRSSPPDIYASHLISHKGLDNYFFDHTNGLADFSRFELAQRVSLPDRFFLEFATSSSISKSGLLVDIDRAWLAVDDKLLLWNYLAPHSSFNHASQFLSIDNLGHPILNVALVLPKPGVFKESINHLLVIATTLVIHIYLVSHDKSCNNLQVFEAGLLVSVQGLAPSHFAFNNNSRDIYFCGDKDGLNIWRLDYAEKSSFTRNKCDKLCLTRNGFLGVLPSKIFGFGDSSTTSPSLSDIHHESIVAMEIDHSRDILYTLSSTSNIRVYNLRAKSFAEANCMTPSRILNSAASVLVDISAVPGFRLFEIVAIQHISEQESGAVQLIAITNTGCRLLFKLVQSTGFSSMISFSTSSSSSSRLLRLGLVGIKFPPSAQVPEPHPDLDPLASSVSGKPYADQLIVSQQKSQLLRNVKLAKIISPGVFLCVKRTKKSDKLFVATINHGTLKKDGKFVEDAEFLKYGAGLGDTPQSATVIHDIVQLTPSMNNTECPAGYANICASQYSKEPLKFAIVTNFGIVIYRFRTAENMLGQLQDHVIETYMQDYGLEEACSVFLFLSCSLGRRGPNDAYKRRAQLLFSASGHNARQADTGSALLPSGASAWNHNQDAHIERVVLSDRFYGTLLLVSRLVSQFWDHKVFSPFPHIKIDGRGTVDTLSIKQDNLLIMGLNIKRDQAEFLTGSLVVLLDFFMENSQSIPGLSTPDYSSDPSQFDSEVCLRAEHIAFSSIIKSLCAMKEALSFLMMLMEETLLKQTNLNEVFGFLSLECQVNLLSLTFHDLLLADSIVKALIKDLLSSIINRSILRGASIDTIASSFQNRCGSFCSTDDVFAFQAIENLTRAKAVDSRDSDLRSKYLNNAAALFEQASESLTVESVQNAIKIMAELKFYNGAIDLLLKLAKKMGTKTTSGGDDNNTQSQLYALIFNLLQDIDSITVQVSDTSNEQLAAEYKTTQREAYDACFKSSDKQFHYAFYLWFIDQGKRDKLMGIETPYILLFLQERCDNNLTLTDLLWLYQAKREKYYEAATILYSLVVSDYDLPLPQRIEYISRANGFCNCVCPPNLRQKMVELSCVLQVLLDAANVQLDVLAAINGDKRISDENRHVAVSQLNQKVLDINELFNTYTDPLGYYELSLVIFKMADYQNASDVLKRYEMLFEKVFHENANRRDREPLHIALTQTICSFGQKVSSSDLAFPVGEIIRLMHRFSQRESTSVAVPPVGAIVNMFLYCKVPHEKLYYCLRKLMENEVGDETVFSENWTSREMAYLIQKWCGANKKLRKLVNAEQAETESYSLENDYIYGILQNEDFMV